MTYQIYRTDKAESQLHDILMYRAEVTGSVERALALLDVLERELSQLADFPGMGAFPRYAALRTRGFRVLIVEKYLVFYKADHQKKMVMIYAIVDGRRDYLNLI